MKQGQIWKRHPVAVFAEVGDEVVFLHGTDGVYYSLDAVGALIWREIAEPRSVGELVALVCEEYEVGPATLMADLQKLGEDLVSRQLLEIQEEV
jgi:hypothetical protein